MHQRGFQAARRAQDFCDAEVEQLGHAIWRDQDVAGLEIAMNDQVLVRVMNGCAHVPKEFETLSSRELMTLAIAVDWHAIDQLHDEVRNTVVSGAAVKQASDIGMIESSEDLPFMAKALKNELRIESTTHQLDRNFPIKFA